MTSRPIARLLARCMLAWFALYLAAAVASPMVLPGQGFELVCSGAGTARLMKKGDGGDAGMRTGVDCPLCAPGSAPPPPAVVLSALPAPPLAYALRSIPSARTAALAAAPLPARGPPRAS